MPGLVNDPSGLPRGVERVAPILDDAQALLVDTEEKLTDAFIDKALPAVQLADQVAMKLAGAVGVKLDNVGKVIQKATDKVNRKFWDKYASVNAHLQQYVPGWPTIEQVWYGNQSNDYLGSMGFIPTVGTDATPPPPPPSNAPIIPAPAKGPGEIDPGIQPNPGGPGKDDPPWQEWPPGGGIIEDPTFPPAGGGGGGPIMVSCTDMQSRPMTLGGGDCAGMYAWVQAGMPGFYPAFEFDSSCYAMTIPMGWCNLWGEDPANPGHPLFQIMAPCGCGLWVPTAGGAGVIVCGPPPAGYCYVPTNVQGGIPGGIGPPGGPPVGTGNKVCVTESPLDCGPPAKGLPEQPQLTGKDRCDDLAGLVAMYASMVPKFGDVLKVGTVGMAAGEKIVPVLQWLFGTDAPVLSTLVDRFGKWADSMVAKAAKNTGCNVEAMPGLSVIDGINQVIQQWFPFIPPAYVALMRQAVNTACQYLLPTGNEANAALLAKTIDDKTWACWQKAAGNLTDPQLKLLYAARSRPDARQLDLLFRRKYLDEATTSQAMREAGVLQDEDGQRIHQLNDMWPGLEDTIRMMVRDVADPNAVDTAKLDEDFELKWQGKLKEYGEALGVTDELAKFYWRAHWRLPSPTQLFEMLHRSRPGRVPEGQAVTADDVRQCLKQDDMAPGWVDRLMAVSYHVVNATDAIHMFQLRTITKEELIDYVEDEGYTHADAVKKADFYEVQRRVSETRRSGLPPPRTLIARYGRGEISRQELNDIIGKITISDEQAQLMREAAELERTSLHRARILKGVKRAYMRGVYDEGEAISELVNGDVEAEEAFELIQDWTQEREAAGKLATTAKLCQWRSMGILTATEHARFLDRLNWSPFQAERIMAECDIKENERLAKLAEQRAKALLAAQEKAQRKAEECMTKEEKCARRGHPLPPKAPKSRTGSPKTPGRTTNGTA